MYQLLKITFYGLFVVFITSVASCTDSAPNIEIQDAYIRGMPASSTTTAAYLRIINHTDQDKILIGGSTPIAESVEIHSHIMNKDSMRMVQLEELIIPANDSVELKPGGLHLMLLKIKMPDNTEPVPLVLKFKDGSAISITTPIRLPSENY